MLFYPLSDKINEVANRHNLVTTDDFEGAEMKNCRFNQ